MEEKEIERISNLVQQRLEKKVLQEQTEGFEKIILDKHKQDEKSLFWVKTVAVTGILSILFSVFAHYKLALFNEALNKPYLRVYPPHFVFLDVAGNELPRNYNPGDINFYEMRVTIEKVGNLPAEIIEQRMKITDWGVDHTSTNKVPLFNEYIAKSGLKPVTGEFFLKLLSNEVSVVSTVKYRVMGDKREKVTTVTTWSTCKTVTTNNFETNINQIGCFVKDTQVD